MKRSPLFVIGLLILGVLACVVPPGMTPTPVVITQIVVITNTQVQPSPTFPLPTVPVSTDTPILPTATVIDTATATLSGPIVVLSRNANCRNGPGTGFAVVTSYLSGDSLQIIGRNPDFNNTWWQIKMPSGGKCWISFSTGQAYGPFDDIPVVP